MLSDARPSTQAILEDAASRQPTEVYALVSGGHDSLTAMHVASQSTVLALDGVLHINTGIGIPATRQFVRERCCALGLNYIEIGRPTGHLSGQPTHECRYVSQEYRQLVLEYGFPGPGAHKWMYANLKENPLQWWLSEQTKGEVVLISGVRKAESDRRMETIDDRPIQRKLGVWWASPLVEWTGVDVRTYRRAYSCPMNPVVEHLEMSAECLCGAYGHRTELQIIREMYPDVWRCLNKLELEVLRAAEQGDIDAEYVPDYVLWGHGNLRDQEADALVDDEQLPLCASCQQRDACELPDRRDYGYQTHAEAFLRDPAFDTDLPVAAQEVT